MGRDDLRAPPSSCGLPTAAPEAVGMSTERLARIGPAMRRYVDEGLVPGIVTVVARRGAVVHFAAQGLADLEERAALTGEAIFRIYSMTKPVTAAAVMIAYEEGRFFLDDPIQQYLPEFAAMKVWTDVGLVEAEQPITIRQLLTHTSGLDYGFYADDPVARLYREAGLNDADARVSDLSTAEYVKRLASLPLYAQPGTLWRYSDAMAVLGRLVEVASGESFGEFLERRIFGPLAMIDTGFYVPSDKAHRLPTLYEIGSTGKLEPTDSVAPADHDLRGIQTSEFSRPPSYESGGAGLVSTAADYLRFAQMLVNRGKLDGQYVLSPPSVRLITSNHLGPEFGETPLASLPVASMRRRGLGQGFCGLVVTDALASGTAGSDGEYNWGGAAGTSFWIDPKQELVGMVLTQVLPIGVDLPLSARLHQMTYQAITSG